MEGEGGLRGLLFYMGNRPGLSSQEMSEQSPERCEWATPLGARMFQVEGVTLGRE